MKQSEFKRRRKRLMRIMGEGSIAILPSAPVRQRNRDVDHPYRPDSDFFYLTGFAEPDAVAVLRPNHKEGEFILFCRERDPKKETWDGLRAGLEGAKAQYGADNAFAITKMDEMLPQMLASHQRVFYAIGGHAELDDKMPQWIRRIRAKSQRGPLELIALDHHLHELRLYKSKAEIKAMRTAAAIAAKAHKQLLRISKPGLHEYWLEAEFLHQCAMRGAREPSYPTIVAGGANACILHYTENSDNLKDGDLVLIDAGCEFDYYASDITRTFPVNGKFSPAQRSLYQLVLKAQAAAIKEVQPGNNWNAPHKAAVRVLTKGLIRLGLLKGQLSRQLKKEGYKRFYMHRTSHWLGTDVHDVGDYKINGKWRLLEPGMVITIEPALYIPLDDKKAAKKWRGIGIRIEDDILVTKDGPEVLSRKAPKSIEEIEAVMAS